MLRCAFAPRSSVQMRFRCARMSSRSTSVNPNELPKCLNAFSLDAGQSKCVSDALARRLLILMRFRFAKMSSRLTPVNPNELPKCLHTQSLDAGRYKCVSDVLRCALARRLSTNCISYVLRCALTRHPPTQMRFIRAASEPTGSLTRRTFEHPHKP